MKNITILLILMTLVSSCETKVKHSYNVDYSIIFPDTIIKGKTITTRMPDVMISTYIGQSIYSIHGIDYSKCNGVESTYPIIIDNVKLIK